MKGIPTDREIDEMAEWFEMEDEFRWEQYCKEQDEIEANRRKAELKY